jgi:hypothetical protein
MPADKVPAISHMADWLSKSGPPPPKRPAMLAGVRCFLTALKTSRHAKLEG